jgi:hypothetical protein
MINQSYRLPAISPNSKLPICFLQEGIRRLRSSERKEKSQGHVRTNLDSDVNKINKDTIKIGNEKPNSKPSLHRRLKNSRVDNLNMQIVRTLNSVEPNVYYGNQSQKQNISVDFESSISRNLYDIQHTPAK